jgi:hypothetical protein
MFAKPPLIPDPGGLLVGARAVAPLLVAAAHSRSHQCQVRVDAIQQMAPELIAFSNIVGLEVSPVTENWSM